MTYGEYESTCLVEKERMIHRFKAKRAQILTEIESAIDVLGVLKEDFERRRHLLLRVENLYHSLLENKKDCRIFQDNLPTEFWEKFGLNEMTEVFVRAFADYQDLIVKVAPRLEIPYWFHQCGVEDPLKDPNVEVVEVLLPKTSDCCINCGIAHKIPEPRLGAQLQPNSTKEFRYHCLDCRSITLCQGCTQVSVSLLSIASKGIAISFPIPKLELSAEEKEIWDLALKLNIHCQHFLIQDDDEAVWMKHHVLPENSEIEGFKLRDLTWNTFLTYSNRPLFGYFKESDGELSFKTYIEIARLSASFAFGLHRLLEPQNLVSICSSNRMEWYITDFACVLGGFPSASLQANWSFEEFRSSVETSKSACLVIDSKTLSNYMKYPIFEVSCASLQHIVIMDLQDEEPLITHRFSRIQLHSIRTLVHFYDLKEQSKCFEELQGSIDEISGRFLLPRFSSDRERGVVIHPGDSRDSSNKDRIFSVIFTSGSTGTPKGAVYSSCIHIKDIFCSCFNNVPFVVPSYLPCAWGTDRAYTWTCFAGGGRTVFLPPPPGLFELLPLVRPTQLVVPPAILTLLYNQFISGSSSCKDSRERKEFASQFSKLLGDRLDFIMTGGAPSSETIRTWAQETYKVPVYNGYGATEAGGISLDNEIDRNATVKLQDVPEMDYLTSDLPFPRGEILVKTDTVIPGYLNNPHDTKEKLSEDGWFRTGDIGEMRASGQIVVIDRKKDLFKLNMGEFVSPAKLENLFSEVDVIEQIFIYGDSMRDFLVAVVVVTKENFMIEGIHQRVLEGMRRFALQKKLRCHEVPRGILVETENFTPENELLTPSFKMNRTKLYKKFRDSIDSLYLELSNVSVLDDQKMYSSLQSVEENVLRIIEDVLKVPVTNRSLSFSELGGQSLEATMFLFHLRNLLKSNNVDPSQISLLTNRALTESSIETVVSSLSRILSSSRSSVQTVLIDLVASRRRILSEKMQNDSCIPPYLRKRLESLKESRSLQSFSRLRGRNIFLTGATGFLGVYLLHDILKSTSLSDAETDASIPQSSLSFRKIATEPGNHTHRESTSPPKFHRHLSEASMELEEIKVYCLVRAGDTESAEKRLISKFDEFGFKWSKFSRRIVAVPGDLSCPLWGLSPDDFASISRNCSSLFLCGADTNSSSSYEELRGRNVISTLEGISFATAFVDQGYQPISIVYISTVSVYGTYLDSASYACSEDLRLGSCAADSPVLNSGGYPCTKWVSERLLEKAAKFGITVSIFRSGFISWDLYSGISNSTDWLTRFFRVVILTKSYPFDHGDDSESFGVCLAPVNFVSESIISLSLSRKFCIAERFEKQSCLFVCNIDNDRGSGFVSFKTLGEWIASIDTSIELIPRDAWCSRIREFQLKDFLPLLEMFETSFPSASFCDVSKLTSAASKFRSIPMSGFARITLESLQSHWRYLSEK
jgi:long-subunit acyl-CoA synthetase (AMP-forming)/thioester reductase-like protein